MRPPLANTQIVTPGNVATMEHFQFLLQMYERLLTAQRPIVRYGPLYINDLPASATTQATQAYFNTATALSRNINEPAMPLAGRIVGLDITSDDNRATGTATARIRRNGTGATWNSGSVVINGTSLNRAANMLSWDAAADYAFDAFDTVGMEVTTSSWSPTTANLLGFIFVQFEAP